MPENKLVEQVPPPPTDRSPDARKLCENPTCSTTDLEISYHGQGHARRCHSCEEHRRQRWKGTPESEQVERIPT